MRLVRPLRATGALMAMRGLRWALLACSGTACLGLAAVTMHVRRPDAPPRVSLEPAAIQGFRTASYEGDQLRLRVSGDSLTLTHPKLIGPFRLGFVYAVVARNVTVDTFPAVGAPPEPAPAGSLAAISALLAQRRLNIDVAEAELAPIKVIEHRENEAKAILSAASCSAGLGSSAITCKDGVIDRGGTAVRFHELSYEGKTKAIRTTP